MRAYCGNSSKNMKKLPFNPEDGFPVGEDLRYRCSICGTVLPSLPETSKGCRCGNIFIDRDYARISVKRENKIELLTL